MKQMDKIINKINKPSLTATIIIASLILGSFFYASQANKQRSIEKQQENKLQEDKRLEKTKTEQAKKEYIAKRKNECYSIYEKERDEWNNVKDVSYSEIRDVCIIKYKSSESAKSKEDCEKMIKNTQELSESLRDLILNNYFDCLENWFSKEF